MLLFAAPLFFSGYGVIRLFGRADGRYGPGLDWQVAHIVGLIGMVLFVPVVLGMGRLLASNALRNSAIAVALIGLATTIVQFVADVVFAAQAADKAEMSRLSNAFSDIPGVRPAFYLVGPPLFFVGLIVLTILLVRAGRLRWWSPVLMAISTLSPMITLDLIPLAGVGMLVSVLPLGSIADKTAASSPAHSGAG
ncbi:hypothetical protein NONI108955_40995 [Nocardia ninae]|uniref:DUF4386 domain-containing protein n=1 Tax=Nocardia ninae NBRC 108245 TaxID=1210091 RepID=A0A511MFE4_9NOCA|nr:hypothetical protein NN4_37980 [Nocardia ninae NBRC 108245]